jgi:hypothetical protein
MQKTRVRFSLDALLIFDLRFKIGDLCRMDNRICDLRFPIGDLCRMDLFNQKSEIKNQKSFRSVLCWYGRAIVNRLVAGSIPAAGAFSKS